MGPSPWAVFRHIQLPKMKRVLTIAVLLRFMDSFMIYTEAFRADRRRSGQFDNLLVDRPGEDRPGAVRPRARRRRCRLIYFVITLAVSWIFYTVMTRDDAEIKGTVRMAIAENLRSMTIGLILLAVTTGLAPDLFLNWDPAGNSPPGANAGSSPKPIENR